MADPWLRAIGHGWLAALFFWSAVPVGSLGYLLLMRLVGGSWRELLAPAMATGTRSLAVPAVATVPILVAMGALYPWFHAPQPGFRGWWLSPIPFVLRSLFWWAGLRGLLAAAARRPASQAVAVIGLVFITLAGSLIAVDWLMSLDPEFHSSGFGLQALCIQFTVALALAIWRARPEGDGTAGGLLITLVMFWGYFAYLPLFIIWSGNAPAGAAWYLARAAGGWKAVGLLAAIIHAVVFLVLLSPGARRSAAALRPLALAVLVANALQVIWMVLPADGPVGLAGLLGFLFAMGLLGAATLSIGRRA